MKTLPINFVVECFFKYAGAPEHYNGNYRGSCPICREGKSWLKKKRCFLLLEKGYFYCQNEQRSYRIYDWIKKVSGLSNEEITFEAKKCTFDYTNTNNELYKKKSFVKNNNINKILPLDYINLFDKQQLEYYKSDKIVSDCIQYIEKRKLNTAINRPKTFFLSLTDYTHKNRLVLPFYNETGKIIFYQSRAIYKQDAKFARYLSKSGSQCSVFGIDRIDVNLDYIFLLEGPIDSMFIKNGVGLCGLNLNDLQKEQLSKYKFHKRIWILDNQLDNEIVLKKYNDLIEKNETIFIFPDKLKNFKDFNDICIKYNINEIKSDFVINNSYKGLQASLKLKMR